MLIIEMDSKDYNNQVDVELKFVADDPEIPYISTELALTRTLTPQEVIGRLRQAADHIEFQESIHG